MPTSEILRDQKTREYQARQQSWYQKVTEIIKANMGTDFSGHIKVYFNQGGIRNLKRIEIKVHDFE